jgi:ankyrin repeat protein/nucleoside phosphorylase
MFGHEAYKTGVICALEFEMSAVRFMLEEEHADLPLASGDPNIYVLGKLSGHYVAIACLPGNQGKGAAAIVATNMSRTFPALELRLLVGIGGGVPSEKHDIRLGDVVIGMPDALHGGVIQYDLGKDTDDAFVLKGCLAPAPSLLRSSVVRMQSNLRISANRIHEHLETMLRKGEGLSSYRRPSQDTDILFDPDSIHISGKDTCAECDFRGVVRRSSRKCSDPHVHYGLIASGDRVMRSARKRSSLRDLGDVLCFEMEAAGILTEYSCLVVRGISDYADSHKSCAWQHYAAAAAAGCTKEILSHLSPGLGPDQSILIGLPGEGVPSTGLTISEKHIILAALRFDQIEDRMSNLRGSHARTCEWLLTAPKYLQWLADTELSNHHGLMWIKGKPGAGKSTLMHYALDNIGATLKNTVTLHFFFNARGTALEKSTVGMYRSLLWQLFKQHDELLSIFALPEMMTGETSKEMDRRMELLHQTLQQTVQSVWRLKKVFTQAIQILKHSSFVCVIDALDECSEQQVRDMLQFFDNLAQHAVENGIRFRVLFSSRHYPHISIESGLEMVLEAQDGHRQDITHYVESELRIGGSSLATRIKREVQKKAAGVFMWVVLVVQILNKDYDRGRVHLLSRNLQGIPTDLNQLFRGILGNQPEHGDELLFCIQLILFAARPLEPRELYCALLFSLDSATMGELHWQDIQDDSIQRFILDASRGLAEVTVSYMPTVQFIHESVRDFFFNENGLSGVWPELRTNLSGFSHERLKKFSLEYMTIATSQLRDMEDSPGSADLKDTYTQGMKKFPFLDYAAQNVLWHADMAAGAGVTQESFILDFPVQRWNWLNAMSHMSRDHHWRPSLQSILVVQDLPNLIDACPPHSWVKPETKRFPGPLFDALADSRDSVVQAIMRNYGKCQIPGSLIYQKCSNYSPERSGIPWVSSGRDRGPLSYVAEHGYVELFLILLETENLSPDEMDWNQRRPLSWAAQMGHEAVVEVLLADARVDPNHADYRSRTALLMAASHGKAGVVKLLIQDSRVLPILQAKPGRRALLHAVRNGHQDIVSLLLANGAKSQAQKALLQAAGNNQTTLVKSLLADGSLDPNFADTQRRTALICAARNRASDVIRLLLANPRVKPNLVDKHGRTAVDYARQKGYEGIVDILNPQSQ